MIVRQFAAIVVGFGSGIIVGSGIVAFLTVLNIVSRLAYITSTYRYVHTYGWAVLGGVLSGSIVSLLPIKLHFTPYWTIGIGLLMGIFVGMLASALAEVVDVIPISVQRMNALAYIILFIFALALGKVFGSLYYWCMPILQ